MRNLSKLIAAGVIGGGGESSLLNGLVSYWKLDEASAGSVPVTRTDSKGTNHLTDPSNASSATAKINAGVVCASASNKLLYCADNTTLRMENHDFTLSAWAYVTTFTVPPLIAGKSQYATNKRSYSIALNASWYPIFQISRDGSMAGRTTVTAPGVAGSSTWFHVCAWYDATAGKMYLSVNNGDAANGDHAGGCYGAATPFCVGAGGNVGAWESVLDGMVDEVGLWYRQLTAAERAALYNGGSGKQYPFR